MMKRLIKFEKHNCPKCVVVENFLTDQGVKAEKIDVESHSDLDFIAKYVEMSLPVVVLLDEKGELIKKSVGYNPPELEEILTHLA